MAHEEGTTQPADEGPVERPVRPLVERLRELSRRGHWPLIGDEAADEIERLQDAMTALLDLFHTGQVSIRPEAAGYAESVLEVGEQLLLPNAQAERASAPKEQR